MQTSSSVVKSESLSLADQYVTFRVGEMFFGVDVARVQEIIRHQPMTPVPLAPDIVRGLVNLRGQIITAIDMRALLQMDKFAVNSTPMNVVIQAGGEVLSLLVDGIGDVLDVNHRTYEPTPETVKPRLAAILDGVFKLDSQLLLILNTDNCLQVQIN
jgi:purine-binding chemotaxis protein CheW